jgi:Domain of unknown function (DUF4333)
VRLPRLLSLALAGAAVLAVSGCGKSSIVIDHSVVETAIETSALKQQHIFTVVSCPKGVVASKGRRFTCTATLRSGTQVPVVVVARDDKGDVHYAGFRGYANGRPGG